MNALLMLFAKNAKAGTVKTRLAATKGQAFALDVYQKLLGHTLRIAAKTHVPTAIFYSDFIEENDLLLYPTLLQMIQKGNDLGERLSHAFQKAFALGYEKVVVIGSDCPGITEEHIHNSLQLLEKNDVVIGPASDGGYYLLGLKQLHPDLFINKSWSSPILLQQTKASIRQIGLSYCQLPMLSDVDDENDLAEYYKFLKQHLPYDESDQ